MATINSSNINITDLDFDDVSKSLKEYLRGQDTLKDYDFEGSNLAILVDLLAYSAHTSAFNANMVASEMFLDTAQIRKNVVSRAKELGEGTIVKVEDRIAHIHWQNGQTLKHRVWEIVVIEDSKSKKKPYYKTWQIKF